MKFLRWLAKNACGLGSAILILAPVIYYTIETMTKTDKVYKFPLGLMIVALLAVVILNKWVLKGIVERHKGWINDWIKENLVEDDVALYNRKQKQIRISEYILTALKLVFPIMLVLSIIVLFYAIERTAATIGGMLCFSSIFWVAAAVLQFIEIPIKYTLKK